MESCYGVVGNIPKDFHTIDLRHFFSDAIERNRFQLFHFLHSLEVQISKHGDQSAHNLCCVVKFWKKEDFLWVKKHYHDKQWINHKKDVLPSRCRIYLIKNPLSLQEDTGLPKIGDREWKYLTNKEKKELKNSQNCSSKEMAELNPPTGLPQGNVGTPYTVLRDQIQMCLLPPAVLKRLGILDTTLKVFREYGRVKYCYEEENSLLTPETDPLPFHGRESKKNATEESADDKEIESKYLQSEASDSDDAEEWERHESLTHEEEPLQLFEEPISLQWEKGGSGLVFYTDDVYWDSLQGEGRESDHWDLTNTLDGNEPSMEQKKDKQVEVERNSSLERERDIQELREDTVGYFEKFSNGVAGRLMRKSGWKVGKGIGARGDGIAHPLELRSQTSKHGLGYYVPPPKEKKKRKDYYGRIGCVLDPKPKRPPKDPFAVFRLPSYKRPKIAFVCGENEKM